jgi:cytochrome c peroxidase
MKRHLFFAGLLMLISCGKNNDIVIIDHSFEIPRGFPEMNIPLDNEFSFDRWALGKRLFFDPVLSRDSTISCSSCHLPELSFTDGKSVSEGVEQRPGRRNAPTLANVGYHPYFTREGGVPTLEMQVLVPIQEHAEFDFNILLVAERLNADSSYVNASYAAYDRAPDAFVITRSISCFERTILSGNSPYDQYLNGDKNALTETEVLGMQLFFSEKLACSNCHSGFDFTNYSFENNGLYETYEDPGRFRLTGEEEDVALFKVPSLRNIAMTEPYMHDGSISNLSDVIAHYNSGGKNHIHKSGFIQPLELTEKEMMALESFLESLTDQAFLSDPKFQK